MLCILCRASARSMWHTRFRAQTIDNLSLMRTASKSSTIASFFDDSYYMASPLLMSTVGALEIVVSRRRFSSYFTSYFSTRHCRSWWRRALYNGAGQFPEVCSSSALHPCAARDTGTFQNASLSDILKQLRSDGASRLGNLCSGMSRLPFRMDCVEFNIKSSALANIKVFTYMKR